MVYGSVRQRSEQITPAEDVAGVFCIPGELSRGTFAYTRVPTMIIRLRA
ncbi:hypothetical protein EC2860050_5141 [Escherichia coli 2860050]|nr:hypothetical protein EC2860050_5141 [Escherichia coli 2860050]